MNKLYSVHDHWTDINKKNDVDIESIDGVITGIKVNGEDYGGSEWQNIFDNTITAILDSDGFYTTNIGVVIEADSIRVTFDGVEYICPKRSVSEISTNYYGALTPLESGEEDYDWSEFPFSIATGTDGESMIVATQTAGTHTLKIDTPQSGGGESDFSTAEVTIKNMTRDEANVYVAFTSDDNPAASFGLMTVEGRTNRTANVILYKNLCACHILIGTLTVTGAATLINPGIVAISGECTIEITAAEN